MNMSTLIPAKQVCTNIGRKVDSNVVFLDSTGLNTFTVPNMLFSSVEAEYAMSSNFSGGINQVIILLRHTL